MKGHCAAAKQRRKPLSPFKQIEHAGFSSNHPDIVPWRNRESEYSLTDIVEIDCYRDVFLLSLSGRRGPCGLTRGGLCRGSLTRGRLARLTGFIVLLCILDFLFVALRCKRR